MKNILITGGLGFIGSHLAVQLSENKNYSVSVIDSEKYFFEKGNLNYNYYKNLREQKLFKNSVKIFKTDLLNKEQIKLIFKENKPDIVIHLASVSVAGIADYYPDKAKENIFDITYNLLQTIVNEFHIERFIYISSSMVYGHFPKDENDNIIPPNEDAPCNPIDIYGSFKLCCEHLIKAFHHRKKLPYVVIRPTAVYGPNDCNFRVTELFVANAILKRPILLDNGGLHLLDFTYVNDLVSGIISTIENPNALNQTFNLSYGEGNSIKELAEIIKDILPNVTINNSECRPFRPNRGALDISKAKKLLDFAPEYSLQKGMKLYIEQVKEHILNLDYPEKYF
ncbi:MAG: NAD(P)-dependent oxidoreductase [Bacteroidia bacterium]|nr:NAD(P)-dependent oxidoreductase [Bacteroidia bacterium]